MKLLTLRMSDNFNNIQDYQCKDECPYCKSKIVNIHRVRKELVDMFTCETNCDIPYEDMISYNKLEV